MSGVTKREYIWLNDLPVAVVDKRQHGDADALLCPHGPPRPSGADDGAERRGGMGRDLCAVRGRELHRRRDDEARHALSGAVVPAGERARV